MNKIHTVESYVHQRKIAKMFGALVILSCLLLACTATDCPVCPNNPFPCHYNLAYKEPCPCFLCLTSCSVRTPICKKGEVCTTKNLYYGKDFVGPTAVCKPFVQCPKIKCPNGCPHSGYFVDQNGCKTCLCNDPCKELKCPGLCDDPDFIQGTDPNYQCL